MSERPFRVLFACIGNSARSVMAQGFAKHHGGANVEARSGGSRPLGHLLPEAVEVMRERGIDISREPSKGFDEPWIRDACDMVITMGCGDDACPAFIGKRMEDWELDDPKGKSIDEFRRIRDEIETRVVALLKARGIT